MVGIYDRVQRKYAVNDRRERTRGQHGEQREQGRSSAQCAVLNEDAVFRQRLCKLLQDAAGNRIRQSNAARCAGNRGDRRVERTRAVSGARVHKAKQL